MKHWKKALYFVVPAAVLVLCFLLYSFFAPNDRPLKDPLDFYQKISQQLASQEIQAYEVVVQSTTRVQGQEFTENTMLLVQNQLINGQLSVTAANRSVSMGGYQFTSTERLEGSTLYLDLNGNRFFGELTQEVQYPPELLLTAQNYSQITGIERGDEVTMEFCDPSAAEAWALPSGAILQSASGTLTASKEGALRKNTYQITYLLGQREVLQTVTVTPSQETAEISDGFDSSSYTKLSVIEAPILLERMSGYLLQSQKISASYQEYIYCQTFGDQRTRDMQLEMNNEDPFYAVLTTDATLRNSSREEDASSVHQSEIFENGTYSRSGNGSEPESDESITAQRFRTHCQDILVGTILLPQFISNTTMEEDDHSFTLRFTPTQELSVLLCEEASQNLYQDPTVLSSLASSTVTEVLAAYLQIDKATGLPLSSGIHYKGIYTITELPYRLEYTTDQNYSFPTEATA